MSLFGIMAKTRNPKRRITHEFSIGRMRRDFGPAS
jgi:hypothetical protein